MVDAIARSHGHRDHFGGLLGSLHAHRRRMRRDLTFHAGRDHFLPRWNQRGDDAVYTGRLAIHLDVVGFWRGVDERLPG